MASKNRSVNTHQFSMIPRADVPRSRFDRQMTHKTTFDAGYLIPFFVDEVLPGDQFRTNATIFARLTTPIFPIMDNLHLDTFWFFVPNRLVWDNWQKFMGERLDPDDSIDFLVPHIVSPAGGYEVNSLQDYFGLPTKGQIPTGNQFEHSALFLRAYNIIWNEWFRDQNLQDRAYVNRGDGPDPADAYHLLRRGKRHDYFTSCLPWPQKGEAVTLPLGDSAPIYATGPLRLGKQDESAFSNFAYQEPNGWVGNTATGTLNGGPYHYSSGLAADLSEATAATVNVIRQMFQVQKLLERDARGGTRYTEIIRSHFGVISPDARLQRPEYLGGSSDFVNISAVAQTSATAISGSDSPLGNLAAIGTISSKTGFSSSFTEHGMIIGLASVRADLTYQQGLHRMWSRKTRYDFYFPVFAALGEQAVLNKEIYCQGVDADEDVFGYQERWAEYRYKPSMITGRFRSTAQGTLDAWHLSQRFNSLPALNSDFISDKPPVERIVAVGEQALGSQFYFDSFISVRSVRPMPMYSVPGLIDHF